MKMQRPVIFFDIEATGADSQRDRIVEIALIKEYPDGKREEKVHRINPGIKIPAEVIKIHGITNEDVLLAPAFRDLAIPLLDFFEGADLAGFGVNRFDVPILVEEFKRAGFPFPKEGTAVIDALTIFHRKEPRDLSAAYQYYCGKTLVGAHGARADALASLEVIKAQVLRYEELPKDVAGLHDFCNKQDERYVDAKGKFIWRDGEAAINFGKYKGELLRHMVKEQRDYMEWVVSEGKFPQDVTDICWKALRGEYPKKEPNTKAVI